MHYCFQVSGTSKHTTWVVCRGPMFVKNTSQNLHDSLHWLMSGEYFVSTVCSTATLSDMFFMIVYRLDHENWTFNTSSWPSSSLWTFSIISSYSSPSPACIVRCIARSFWTFFLLDRITRIFVRLCIHGLGLSCWHTNGVAYGFSCYSKVALSLILTYVVNIVI